MKCAYTDIGRNSHKTTSTTSISRHVATTTTQTAAAGKKLTVEIFLSDIEKWPVTFYGFFELKFHFGFYCPLFVVVVVVAAAATWTLLTNSTITIAHSYRELKKYCNSH